MWIKICGNTRLEDCVVAAEAGADAVGFIFASGKRLITADHARAITSELPQTLETIGVFTQTNAAQILATAASAGVTGIQLHSAFDPGRARIIRRHFPSMKGRMRVLQVVHWLTDVPAEAQMERFRGECNAIADSGLADALLVDSRTAQASGGTGVTFDWSAAAPALQGLGLPVIVAGGLRPENVGAAIDALKPDGVDTSSGVEVSPGVKDHDRIRSFIGVVRG
jgi:phosphoribosylanthranilate isomerase